MKTKVYISSGQLVIDDSTSVLSGPANNVNVIRKDVGDKPYFSFKGVPGRKENYFVHIDDLLKESGSPYTLQGFTDFYEKNIGGVYFSEQQIEAIQWLTRRE